MNKSTYEQKIIYKIGSKTQKNGNNNHGSNVRLTGVKHFAPPGINKERKMDAVIMDVSSDAREIIELVSFLCEEGFENIIVFSHLGEKDFYLMQISFFEGGIPAIPLKCSKGESRSDLLKSVRGSLTGSFLVVYSTSLSGYDIEEAREAHRKSGKGATLLLSFSTLEGVYFENEIFDYLEMTSDLERGAISRIFEDDEGEIYYLSSYELY